MAENEEPKGESLLEKISEKIKDHESSSSSSSDSEDEKPKSSSAASLKSKVFRIFGREKPIHKVLGGGKRMRFFCSSYRILSRISTICGTIAVLLFHFFTFLDFHFSAL